MKFLKCETNFYPGNKKIPKFTDLWFPLGHLDSSPSQLHKFQSVPAV